MARLDVHTRRDAGVGLLLDVQSDLLSDLTTRLVVPLLPETEAPRRAARLNPLFTIGGETFVMATQFAAAVRVAELGARVDSLAADHDAVTAALDLLILGV